MITFRLFADESHAGEAKPSAGFYVAAGWIARLSTWIAFDTEWQQVLSNEQLREFHMGPCEKGAGVFKGMTREERARLQRQFIDVIKRHSLFGVVCSVALKPWRKHEATIRAALPAHLKHFVQPHVFAMHGLTVAATRVLALGEVPSGEQVSFTLDRHVEFQGRVEDLWLGGSLQNAARDRGHYLGDLGHGNKKDHPGLQAADIAAYEEYRRLTGSRNRWQINLLEQNHQLTHREVMNDRFFKIAVRELRELQSTANGSG